MKTCFVGDFCPTEITNPLFASGAVDVLFEDTLSLFAGNDVNMINVECALTEADTPIRKIGPNLKATPKAAEVLAKVGFTHATISNNHTYDFGPNGFTDTVENLMAAGITPTGYGKNAQDARKNLIIEKDGEKLAIVAVCEHEYTYALENRMGCRPFDEFETVEDVRDAKAQADRVVVLYHGGKEHCQYPSPRLRRLCRALVRAGADMVLCQHSHCIGCYENYEGGHILYGQGNFHFVYETLKDKEEEELWNSGLALGYDSTANTVTLTPYVVKGKGIELAKGEEKEAILSAFESRNASLIDGTWINGWRAFCESVKENYTQRLYRAFAPDATDHQLKCFGHYLDCEAHTDVWRELFKTANHTNEK